MICFLSGGHGPGGAQSIQLALFKALVAKGEQCKLFDLVDGWVHQSFIDTGLPFVFVEIQLRDKKDYSKHLCKEDLLIVFDGNLFGNLLLFSHCESKVLIWEIYYPWVERFIYTRYFPFKWLALSQEIKILGLIVKNNAFYFIDVMGKDMVEKRLNVQLSDLNYLPIPIDNFDVDCATNGLGQKMSISYVGRSVIWKIMPISKIISDLIESKTGGEININIICDDKKVFHETLLQLTCLNDISVSYYENLNKIELNELLQHSDLHIGMGTSALDGAKLGIPTILIDGSYDHFPESYKYRWIYETENLNLGRIINNKTSSFDGCHSLVEMIESIRINKEQIATECRNYVLKNYHVELVVEKICRYKTTATLTMEMFSRFFVCKYFRILRNFGIK